MHGRDPGEELDEKVHSFARVREASGAKIEQGDGEVADEKSDHAIARYGPCTHAEHGPTHGNTKEGRHVHEHIADCTVL